jgi:hypothetical protein
MEEPMKLAKWLRRVADKLDPPKNAEEPPRRSSVPTRTGEPPKLPPAACPEIAPAQYNAGRWVYL